MFQTVVPSTIYDQMYLWFSQFNCIREQPKIANSNIHLKDDEQVYASRVFEQDEVIVEDTPMTF